MQQTVFFYVTEKGILTYTSPTKGSFGFQGVIGGPWIHLMYVLGKCIWQTILFLMQIFEPNAEVNTIETSSRKDRSTQRNFVKIFSDLLKRVHKTRQRATFQLFRLEPFSSIINNKSVPV